MDIEEVKELINCHEEGDYLDFKEYDQELVKYIIAFANYIVIEINTLTTYGIIET